MRKRLGSTYDGSSARYTLVFVGWQRKGARRRGGGGIVLGRQALARSQRKTQREFIVIIIEGSAKGSKRIKADARH